MKQLLLQTFKRLIPWVGFGFFLLAAWLAHRELKHYHVGRIRDLLFAVPRAVLLKASIITASGYFVLIFYDLLSLKTLGRNVSFMKTAFTAFLSFSVSHNAGHAWLSGSSLRYRFYNPNGVSGTDILKLMFLNSIAYGLGLCSLLLGAYAWNYGSSASPFSVPGYGVIIILIGIIYLGYWVAVIAWKPVLKLKQFEMHLPSFRATVLQAMTGVCDIGLSALVLYVLLISSNPVPFSEFLIVYIFALLLGTASQVPGGLGVFETTVLHFLSYRYPATEIIASLILYRVIYYFLPLTVAGLLFVGYEILCARRRTNTADRMP